MLNYKINVLFFSNIKNVISLMVIIFFCQGVGWADGSEDALDEIVSNIEKKYHNAGFRTDFVQSSVLQALEMTDTASGHALFRYPGMMKWEYEKPEKQSIITDGLNLWIYRPLDNQVAVGKFPSLFGDGRGAGFLSDISILRKNFSISKEKNNKDSYILTLIPENENQELSRTVSQALSKVILHVSKKEYTVTRVVTYNMYGDETIIELNNIDFTINPDKSVFVFPIPENTDIIQLD